MQPIGISQRVFRGRNDFDIFEARGLHAVGDELRGAQYIRDMLRQSTYAGNTQESLELVEKTLLVFFHEEVGGLRHTLL